MSIRDIPKNPLIEKLDGIFASFPTINVKGKKWRRRRNAFFLGELLEIEAAIQAGADENVLRAQYAELIQYRGSEQNQMDFKLRMDIFQDIPKTKTKTKRRKGKKMTKNEIEQRILVAISDMKEYIGRGLLEDWQKMCDDLNISPIPTSVMQCKKAIEPINVNIYDFLSLKKAATHFASVVELREYSSKQEKIFPRQRAKELGPVAKLLRLLY